jgi:hypothetical protein
MPRVNEGLSGRGVAAAPLVDPQSGWIASECELSPAMTRSTGHRPELARFVAFGFSVRTYARLRSR